MGIPKYPACAAANNKVQKNDNCKKGSEFRVNKQYFNFSGLILIRRLFRVFLKTGEFLC